MIFEAPAWLIGLLALPALAALEVLLTGRDRDRTARLVARPLWGPRRGARPAERWRFVRLALLLVGAPASCWPSRARNGASCARRSSAKGVDVVLVLDTSGSMATEDVSPNRFFLARQALAALIARLEGDRFGLVAFEGEAYPLVPLTLDADALGLFLETLEPGIVPAPGTSLGVGLAKGLDLFVDKDRRNKVMVLVSDGEDLEGDVDEAVRKAKEAGVVVHTVGVGTEAGQPVPDFDREGRRVGFKRDSSGQAVVSRLNLATLEAIARGTGGQAFRITPADTSLSGLASAIEGMEQKTLAREYSYRRKERFQVPLAVGLFGVALGLLLPLPSSVGAPPRPRAARLRRAPSRPCSRSASWPRRGRSRSRRRRRRPWPRPRPPRSAGRPPRSWTSCCCGPDGSPSRGATNTRPETTRRRSRPSSRRPARGRRTLAGASTWRTASTRTASSRRRRRSSARSAKTRPRRWPRRRASTSATRSTRSRTTAARSRAIATRCASRRTTSTSAATSSWRSAL